MKVHIALGVCFFLATSNIFASQNRALQAATDIQTFVAAIDLFKDDVGRYPTTEEGLSILIDTSNVVSAKPGGYIKNLGKDPWGREYLYKNPGSQNKDRFDLWSYGKDGLSGGERLDRDIGNWPASYSEISSMRKKDFLDLLPVVLPVTILIGILFSGTVYLGISLLRLLISRNRRASFTGLSIWIGLAMFVLYWGAAIPIILD